VIKENDSKSGSLAFLKKLRQLGDVGRDPAGFVAGGIAALRNEKVILILGEREGSGSLIQVQIFYARFQKSFALRRTNSF
jgi:hypothetical protein